MDRPHKTTGIERERRDSWAEEEDLLFINI
jgi:hypothetical protein